MPDVEGELRARAEADGVEFFFAMFVDMHGKPCAKMVPIEALDVLLGGGAGFAGFAAGPMGQSPADPDMIAVPDPASYMLAPWQPGLAVLQCDIHVEGEPWPYAPRLILKGMLEKAHARGLQYKVGCEAEYFLVRRLPDGGIEVADPLDRSAAPCYDAKGLTRMYDHLTTVSKYVNRLGWANYANDHEDANGQFEQNFQYADALTSADRLIFFRYMVHMVAHQAGLAATFMPKPFANLTGSGLHLHSSLWDASIGRGTVRRPRRCARTRAVGDGVSLHRRADRACTGNGRRYLPDGEFLQAHRSWRAGFRRHLGACIRDLRGEQPHSDAARARRRPGREQGVRRRGEPVPRHVGSAGCWS